jgi:hypothetical protein
MGRYYVVMLSVDKPDLRLGWREGPLHVDLTVKAGTLRRSRTNGGGYHIITSKVIFEPNAGSAYSNFGMRAAWTEEFEPTRREDIHPVRWYTRQVMT